MPRAAPDRWETMAFTLSASQTHLEALVCPHCLSQCSELFLEELGFGQLDFTHT